MWKPGGRKPTVPGRRWGARGYDSMRCSWSGAYGGSMGTVGDGCSTSGEPLVVRLRHAPRRESPEVDRWLVVAAGRLGCSLASVRRTASPEAMTTASCRSDRRTLSLGCKRTQGQANGRITAVLKGNPAEPGAYGVGGAPSTGAP